MPDSPAYNANPKPNSTDPIQTLTWPYLKWTFGQKFKKSAYLIEYLNNYWTDLHQRFRYGRGIYADKRNLRRAAPWPEVS